ncbi:MAG: hypothetical protein J6I49_01215 [Bacteroidales bacterium]|nr:hypothetical protein [Bacteroidales bacterium]
MKSQRITDFLTRYRIPLLLAAALLPAFFCVIDYAYRYTNADMGTSVYYFVGYETGFGGRKLLGTLYGLVLPHQVGFQHLRPFIIGINLLMLTLFLCFATGAVRRLPADASAAPLLLAYLAGPFSVTGFVHSRMSLYFTETYTLALTLAWLLLFLRCPRRWWYYLLTLLLSATACLIHHTFCCTFFPLMAALMLHEALKPEGGIDWRRALPYGAVCAAMGALLVAVWFFGNMNVDCDTLHRSIVERTTEDAYGRGSLIRDYFYISNSENSRAGFVTWELRLPVEFALTLLLLSPLLAVLAHPWVRAWRQARGLAGRLRYLLTPLACLAMTLPMFVMATDYGRWWTALCFTLFALPLALAAGGDGALREALERQWALCRRHPLALAALAVYLLQLAPHQQYPYFGLHQAMRLREFMGL